MFGVDIGFAPALPSLGADKFARKSRKESVYLDVTVGAS